MLIIASLGLTVVSARAVNVHGNLPLSRVVFGVALASLVAGFVRLG